jgi:hypothetical protein
MIASTTLSPLALARSRRSVRDHPPTRPRRLQLPSQPSWLEARSSPATTALQAPCECSRSATAGASSDSSDTDTDNGPDLYLYLSPNGADGDEAAFDDGHLSLGRLKGNLGDQNYEVPAEADLARYHSVVIWCDRFNSAFGAASLI